MELSQSGVRSTIGQGLYTHLASKFKKRITNTEGIPNQHVWNGVGYAICAKMMGMTCNQMPVWKHAAPCSDYRPKVGALPFFSTHMKNYSWRLLGLRLDSTESITYFNCTANQIARSARISPASSGPNALADPGDGRADRTLACKVPTETRSVRATVAPFGELPSLGRSAA